jgi:hypothetical protein
MERLEAYVDMFDAFGFNAIESHDRFNDNYLAPLFGIVRSEWRGKVLRMADVAHENGQQFFLRIWGHTVMRTPELGRELGPNESVPKKLKHFCPNDSLERGEWKQEIRDYYVRHYAGRIDNLIGHWTDPGICRRNGCNWQTPLLLHMDLHSAFKARDSKFTSTFSLWFFDVTSNREAWAAGGWPGYTNDQQLINAGILSKDVMIATASAGIPIRSLLTGADLGAYKPDIVEAILDAGHKPALWTWYRADHEIRPSLHIHLRHGLGDYFQKLPVSARELEWHNIERNVHAAANTANYYVAGRLMWEPALDPDQLLLEFLTLTFGAENAPRLLPAYQAIEQIRCNSCDKNWEKRRFTGAGTSNPERDARRAQAALDELARVKVEPDFRPRIPLEVTPGQIVADLRESLTVIRDFAMCRSRDLPALEKAVASKDPEAITSMVEKLRERYSPWALTLAGRQEWSVFEARLNTASLSLKE